MCLKQATLKSFENVLGIVVIDTLFISVDVLIKVIIGKSDKAISLLVDLIRQARVHIAPSIRALLWLTWNLHDILSHRLIIS